MARKFVDEKKLENPAEWGEGGPFHFEENAQDRMETTMKKGSQKIVLGTWNVLE